MANRVLMGGVLNWVDSSRASVTDGAEPSRDRLQGVELSFRKAHHVQVRLQRSGSRNDRGCDRGRRCPAAVDVSQRGGIIHVAHCSHHSNSDPQGWRSRHKPLQDPARTGPGNGLSFRRRRQRTRRSAHRHDAFRRGHDAADQKRCATYSLPQGSDRGNGDLAVWQAHPAIRADRCERPSPATSGAIRARHRLRERCDRDGSGGEPRIQGSRRSKGRRGGQKSGGSQTGKAGQ